MKKPELNRIQPPSQAAPAPHSPLSLRASQISHRPPPNPKRVRLLHSGLTPSAIELQMGSGYHSQWYQSALSSRPPAITSMPGNGPSPMTCATSSPSPLLANTVPKLKQLQCYQRESHSDRPNGIFSSRKNATASPPPLIIPFLNISSFWISSDFRKSGAALSTPPKMVS